MGRPFHDSRARSGEWADKSSARAARPITRRSWSPRTGVPRPRRNSLGSSSRRPIRRTGSGQGDEDDLHGLQRGDRGRPTLLDDAGFALRILTNGDQRRFSTDAVNPNRHGRTQAETSPISARGCCPACERSGLMGEAQEVECLRGWCPRSRGFEVGCLRWLMVLSASRFIRRIGISDTWLFPDVMHIMRIAALLDRPVGPGFSSGSDSTLPDKVSMMASGRNASVLFTRAPGQPRMIRMPWTAQHERSLDVRWSSRPSERHSTATNMNKQSQDHLPARNV